MRGGSAYEALADTYDERFASEARETWRAGILRLTTPQIADRAILDLGAGTGVGGRLLNTRKPGFIVGMDIAASMLAKAADAYSGRVVGDLQMLPFSAGAFDLCVCGFDTLNHFTLAQIESVLSANNIGAITYQFAFDCFTKDSEDSLIAAAREYDIFRLGPGILTSVHRVGGNEIQLMHFLPRFEELCSCAESCGWRVREVVEVRAPNRAGVPGHKALCLERV